MRLERLTLENWGPFKGAQEIDLTTTAEAPVVLIYGENMRGKTSLLRALRWVLYGRVTAHDRSLIADAEFANYDVRDEGGEFEFGVSLDYVHRGKRVTLSRRAQAEGRRTASGCLTEVTGVRAYMLPEGGQPVPERDIAEFVQRMLHPDIADFFLFDGEMLARFEERLRDANSSEFVRRQIEMALGVPALRQVRSDVTALGEQVSQEVRRLARAEQTSRHLAAELQEVDDEIARHIKDRKDLEEAARDAARALADLEEALKQVEEIRETYHARAAAVKAMEDCRRDWEGTFDDLRRKLEANWWLPLADTLRERWAQANEALVREIDAQKRRALLEREIADLENQSRTSTCPTCNRPLPVDQEAISSRIRQKQAELAAIGGAPQDIAEPSVMASRLAKFGAVAATVESIQETERDLMRLALRIEDERTRIAEFTERIEGNDIDIAALEKRRQDAALSEREARNHIATIDRKLETLRRRQADITKRIARTSPSSTPLRAEMDVLDSISTILEDALDQFRDVTRRRVEREASRIFTTLTTEPDYAGLRIDGKYYLNIVDQMDRVIGRRSAGADQIVTMALIGALARCAVEEGPIVMDTPFGRLDRGHRKRVLEWVAALDTQAVLFVQSGEFVRESDLKYLQGRVGREYELVRSGATSTRIEKVQA